jgi:hypothetical protein
MLCCFDALQGTAMRLLWHIRVTLPDSCSPDVSAALVLHRPTSVSMYSTGSKLSSAVGSANHWLHSKQTTTTTARATSACAYLCEHVDHRQ